MLRGLIEETDPRSSPWRLQITQVSVLPNDVCQNAYKGRFVPPSVLCAGFTWGGQDACYGRI